MEIPFVLTRYLYIKEDVYISLVKSVFEKDYDQSLFWASELYFSGFQQETIEFIYAIYTTYFESNNPKLKNIMDVGLIRYDSGIHIAATMLLNLTSKRRDFTLQDFVMKNEKQEPIENAKEKETKIIIFSKMEESSKYENYVNDDVLQRNVLKEACLYESCKHLSDIFNCSYKVLEQQDLYKEHMYKWLYYASFSPIWEQRIVDFKGIIDDENKTVSFSDENMEEFYQLYGYELDEQSKEIQNKVMHTSLVKQFTNHDLLKKYEKNRKTKKLKLVNNVSSQCKQSTAP